MVNRQFRFSVVLTLAVIMVAPIVRDRFAANAQSPQRASRLQGFGESLAMTADLLSRGRGIEAENLARALLARVEAALGPDVLEAAEVLDLLGRAVRRSTNVTVEEKTALAERAVAIKERILGPWNPDLATSLTHLAIQRTLAGNPAGGKLLLERAVAIREKTLGADDLSVAATLGTLAGVLMTLRDDAGAQSALERVLRIRESAYGAAHLETIKTRVKIAIFFAEITDYAGAHRHYDRALALAESTIGSGHPLTLEILLRDAMVLSEGLGDYAASAQLNERLIRGVEQTFGPADPRLTVALRNLALDRRDLGDYGAAQALAARSLSIAERAFGAKHPDVASSMHTLATVLAAQGDYAEALRAFERATQINEEAIGPSNPELSRASWFIRELFPVSGYDAEDVPLFEEAIALREKAAGLASRGAVESLTNLAAILSTVDDYKRTRPVFERALAAMENTYGPNHPDVAAAATNLADVLAHGGDTAAAMRLYDRALNILERSFAPDHPRVATSLRRLARLRLQAGELSHAMALENRALTIQQQHLGPTHPDVGDTLSSISLLQLRAGATGDAFAAAARAEAVRRDHIRLTARTLAERQALAYSSSAASALDVMMSVAAFRPADHEMVSPAWDALIQSRGIVFDEMAARHRAASAAGDPDVVALTKNLATARQRWAAAVLRGIRNDTPGRYRRLLDRTRNDHDTAERLLAEQSIRFRSDQATRRMGVAELSTTLPDRSALIGFARYRRHTAVSSDLAYLAFVLRQGGAPVVVPLGTAAAIDALVAAWQRQIHQEVLAGGRATARSEVAYRRAAGELRARVWDPVRPHLAGADRVFIVPDGALHLVSFAALPGTGSDYLVEGGPVIHYVSAERDLVDGETGQNAGGLLAVGNPAFDESEPAPSRAPVFRGGRPGCNDFRSVRFARLPGSLTEIDAVVSLWNNAKRQTVRLTGTAATEAAFKTRAAGHRVLHVATHGFFLGDCEPVARENPLLLSGLLLAGANQRDAALPEGEDGVLTAEEVASLDLTGVEWAVLSGCDTGVGEIRAGEGVFGLRRAFQVAGAKTVVMSLWPVEDRTTRQWMTALYENRLRRNMSTADAVREASLSTLRARRTAGASTHPLYWAAFVAAGDWR